MIGSAMAAAFRDDGQEIDRLDAIAQRMDSQFRIPGTRIRIGLDSILGLVPGIGDALAFAPACYIIARARRMGAPRPLLLRMGLNTGLDLLIGSVPLVGDIFDVGNKANRRNVALLRRHLMETGAAVPGSPRKEQRAKIG